ncbi:hypothetical protein E3P77_00713 [Wallemia ichthyophaga]|nr:hypothetical protein E3P77_00713 [Wallemia ichthyophaga]
MTDSVKERLTDQLKRSEESTVKDETKDSKNKITFNSNFQQLYFIFTESGKPVFNSDEFHDSYRLSIKQFNQALKSKTSLDSLKTTSIKSLRLGNVTNISNGSTGLDYTSLMGVLNLIFNLVSIDGDELKFIKANNDLTIHFSKFDHLIYVYLSNLNESNKIISTRLCLLHEQVLSIIPKHHLNKILTTKPNYDLRQLVEGSEALLKNFIISLESSFHYNLQAIQPFKMDFKFRSHIGNLLIPPKHLRSHHLYTILFAFGKVITIIRPKRHNLIIILNTVTSSPSLRSCESWLPLSLPKFITNGFLNAYIAFIPPSAHLRESMGFSSYPEIGVIHITGNPESFDDVSSWWYTVKQTMVDQGVFDDIYKGASDSIYSCGDVSVPGLRHFIFKSKANVQITCPTYDSIYAQDMHSRQRLLNSYDKLYNLVHSPSSESSIPKTSSGESLRSPNDNASRRDSTFADRSSIIGSGDSLIRAGDTKNLSTEQSAIASSSASVSTTQQEDEDKNPNESSEIARPRQEEQNSNSHNVESKRIEKQNNEQTYESNQSDNSDHVIPTTSNLQINNDNMKDTELTLPHRVINSSISQQLLRATVLTPANMLKATTSMMSYVPSLPQLGPRRINHSPQAPQQIRPRTSQRVSYFIKNEHESVLVWSTRIFELYIALPASMPHSAAVNCAQSLVKWVRKEEPSLFLGNTPTF